MRALILAAALVATSCGFAGPAPSIAIPLGTNDFGGYELLVYDEAGLVVGGQSLGQRDEPRVDGVVALPERQELQLAWTGGACSHRPTLHVSGLATRLELVLRNPPDQPFPPLACPAVGIPLAVTIALSEPVSQNNVTLEIEH